MIRTEGLTKKYKNVTALSDLNLHIREGIIYGFIGPNGAGKSTTMKILCALLRPTAGKAFIDGHDVTRDSSAIKRIVGYMPELFGTYEEMRVWEYLDFFGAAFKIPPKKRKTQIEEIMHLTKTFEWRDYFVDTLSRGMRQRVGIAKTLVHDPKVLLLDEPTSGLDPRARIEMRALLRQLSDLGKTLLVSSHILPDLATVCDEIGIIEHAKLLVSGDLSVISRQVRQHRLIEIEVLSSAKEARELLMQKYDLPGIEVLENIIRLDYSGQNLDIAGMLDYLVSNKVNVLWFREVPADLEEVFMTVTRTAREARNQSDQSETSMEDNSSRDGGKKKGRREKR